jgi:hypothetical protein
MSRLDLGERAPRGHLILLVLSELPCSRTVIHTAVARGSRLAGAPSCWLPCVEGAGCSDRRGAPVPLLATTLLPTRSRTPERRICPSRAAWTSLLGWAAAGTLLLRVLLLWELLLRRGHGWQLLRHVLRWRTRPRACGEPRCVVGHVGLPSSAINARVNVSRCHPTASPPPAGPSEALDSAGTTGSAWRCTGGRAASSRCTPGSARTQRPRRWYSPISEHTSVPRGKNAR